MQATNSWRSSLYERSDGIATFSETCIILSVHSGIPDVEFPKSAAGFDISLRSLLQGVYLYLPRR
jgi:hypothetical protein